MLLPLAGSGSKCVNQGKCRSWGKLYVREILDVYI